MYTIGLMFIFILTASLAAIYFITTPAGKNLLRGNKDSENHYDQD